MRPLKVIFHVLRTFWGNSPIEYGRICKEDSVSETYSVSLSMSRAYHRTLQVAFFFIGLIIIALQAALLRIGLQRHSSGGILFGADRTGFVSKGEGKRLQ